MSEEETKKKSKGISRREFLRDAGLVAAGAAAGSTALLAACVPEKVTTLKYVCPYDSLEFDTLAALTAHVESAHPALVSTIAKFVCPYDSLEFPTLAALQAHVAAAHPVEVPVEGLITLTVNGDPYLLKVEPYWSLVYVLREKLGLTGTKIGCDRGTCGTCTVIMDGRPVYSCLVLAVEAEGKNIQTIEGLSDEITLHPIQQAFVDGDASQCGYCIPGFIMAAKALRDKNPSPTRDAVREALSGHFCVCGNTKKIVDAVLKVKGG